MKSKWLPACKPKSDILTITPVRDSLLGETRSGDYSDIKTKPALYFAPINKEYNDGRQTSGTLSAHGLLLNVVDGTLALTPMPLPVPLGLNNAVPLGGGSGTGSGSNPAATIRLVDLRITTDANGGATELQSGAKAPGDTRFAAKPAFLSRQDLVIEAVFDPDLSKRPADVPKSLVWRGGGADRNWIRAHRVISNDGRAGKHVVTCTLGGVTKTLVLYAFGANPTGFKNSGSFSSDNRAPSVVIKAANAGFDQPLGVNGPDPTSGKHLDPCETQFTVVPPEMVADAKAGLFNKDSLQFRVTRKAMQRVWVLVADSSGKRAWQEKTSSNYSIPNAAFDDDHSDDKHLDPWDTGHLYAVDGPGDDNLEKDDDTKQASNWLGFVGQFRMSEFVVFRFGSPAAKTDPICSSKDQAWHDFRRLLKLNGKWANDTTGTNEIAAGDPGKWSPPK